MIEGLIAALLSWAEGQGTGALFGVGVLVYHLTERRRLLTIIERLNGRLHDGNLSHAEIMSRAVEVVAKVYRERDTQ